MEGPEKKPLLQSHDALVKRRSPGRAGRWALWALLLLLALGAGWWAAHLPQADAPAAEPPPLALLSRPQSEMQSVTVSQNGQSYTLQKTADGYAVAERPDYPLVSVKAELLFRQCASVTAQSVVSDGGDPARFGLAESAARVCVRYADGSAATLLLGDLSPLSVRYAALEGEKRVYAVSPSVAATLSPALAALHTVQTPVLEGAYSPAALTIRMLAADAPLPVLEIEKQKQVFSASGYRMLQPVRYGVDAEGMAALIENVAALSATAYVGELDELPVPFAPYAEITMRGASGAALHFTLGQAADEQSRYLLLDDSGTVYVTPQSGAAFLAELSLEGLTDRFIALVDILRLRSLAVTRGGQTAVLAISEDGRYLLNDAEVEQIAFKRLYQQLCSLTADGLLHAPAPAGAAEAELTYALTDGSTHSVQFFAMDEVYCAVVQDGAAMVYVRRDKVEQAIGGLWTDEAHGE